MNVLELGGPKASRGRKPSGQPSVVEVPVILGKRESFGTADVTRGWNAYRLQPEAHESTAGASLWNAYGQPTDVLTWILKRRKLVASRSLDEDWAEVGDAGWS